MLLIVMLIIKYHVSVLLLTILYYNYIIQDLNYKTFLENKIKEGI